MQPEVTLEDTKTKTTKLKVLIADDDPPTRILLRAAVGQWGYDIVEAKDGEEAWDLLQQPNPPRLLILDWLMPKLDGIGLCARVKSNTNLHFYIILLTQLSGSTNVVKGLEAGADEFLSKPFNMAELRSRLAVGAKIIAYENEIIEKNTTINKCIDDIKLLSTLINELSSQDNDPKLQTIKSHLLALENELKNQSKK